MDILFISQYFHPEQFLNTHIVRELAARQHRVEVVCCVPNYPVGKFFEGYSNSRRTEEAWDGVGIHRVFTIPRGKGALQLIANYLTYPLAACWKIPSLGRRRGAVSVVSMPSPIFQALAGIFAKRIWSIPTLFWVQDIWPDSAIITLGIRNRVVIRLLNAVCGWIYRQADLVMVQSDGFHDKIAAFGVSAERIVTLPNCAPPGFAPVERSAVPERIASLFPTGRCIIMFAGNIGESQDFDTIVKAAELLPADSNILLAIVGSGRDEARIRGIVAAQRLEHRFLFLGRHPEADMPAFFACADAMLVSLRDEAIFALTVPSKVQSYLACGKPILASMAGEGAAVIERAGVGKVVAPSAPAALSQAMTEVAGLDKSGLAAMGALGRQVYTERFSVAAVTDSLCRMIESVSK